MPGPDPDALWYQRYGDRITVSFESYLWSGNEGNRKARAISMLKRLMRFDWRCHWCGDDLPAWRRVDAQHCREGCRKMAARSRRKTWSAT